MHILIPEVSWEYVYRIFICEKVWKLNLSKCGEKNTVNFMVEILEASYQLCKSLTEYWNSKVTGLVAENLVSQLYIHWQAHTSDVFL